MEKWRIEKEVIKKELDFSKTYEYFLDHIDGGHILGKTIVQNVVWERGSFFTLMPKEAKWENLYNFPVGDINPVVSTNEVHYVEGKPFIPDIQITTFWEVSEFIKKFLEENEKSIAICEDVHQSRKDPPLVIPHVQLHFYEDQVYYSLSRENSVDEIDHTVGYTDKIWQSLVVLAVGLKLPNLLEMQDIYAICRAAQYVITSAHDGENCIFWKKTEETPAGTA